MQRAQDPESAGPDERSSHELVAAAEAAETAEPDPAGQADPPPGTGEPRDDASPPPPFPIGWERV